MRPAVLLIVLASLLVACGKDEYGTGQQPAAGGAQAGDTAKTPEKTPAKKPQTMSPMAVEVKGQHDLVKNERDPAKKKQFALDAAAKYAGASGDALLYVGMLYRIGEDWEKAADAFVRFTSACPDDLNRKTGLYYAAECLSKAGKVEEAVTYIDELAAKHPEAVDLIRAAASEAGTALFLEGKFEKAVPALERAVSVGHPYAGLELVETLWVLGEFDKARTKAKELLSNFEDRKEKKHYEELVNRAERIGKPAPKLEVEGWSDDSFDPASLSGKVYVIYFWDLKKLGGAKKNERLLKTLFDRYSGEGLQVVGLSKVTGYDLIEGKPDPNMPIEKEVKQLATWAAPQNMGTPWVLGLCRGEANHTNYCFWSLPTFALVDKAGRFRYVLAGRDEPTYERLGKVIEKILDE